MQTERQKALSQLAALLETPTAWLDSLIDFESGWNPAAINPTTGAEGLIQFMPATAQGLGYLNAHDLVLRYPTAEKQLLTPVYNYLKQFKPFPTKQSLYMAVFYPAARTWTPDTLFPVSVRAANPNIDTVQDYINFVEKKKTIKRAIKGGAIILLLAAAYITLTQLKKDGEKWPIKTEEESSI